MGDNLIEIAKKANCGDKEAILEIIVKFTPLIKKYSRLLYYDGADTDLIISFIETIYSLPVSGNMKEDKEVVAYITISLRNEYIKLSKKYSEIKKMEIPLDDKLYCIKSNDDFDTNILIDDLMDNLSSLQKYILMEIFIEDRTEIAISKELKITKQAVNNAKNRALKRLRKEMDKHKKEMVRCRMS